MLRTAFGSLRASSVNRKQLKFRFVGKLGVIWHRLSRSVPGSRPASDYRKTDSTLTHHAHPAQLPRSILTGCPRDLAPRIPAPTPAPPGPSPETPGCAGAPTSPAHPPVRSKSLRPRTETPPGPPPYTSGPDRASPPPTSVSTAASTAASGRPSGPT